MVNHAESKRKIFLSFVDVGKKILPKKKSAIFSASFQEVDMAAAPLVPTAERREVVDFSRPYMQGGITMLMYRYN